MYSMCVTERERKRENCLNVGVNQRKETENVGSILNCLDKKKKKRVITLVHQSTVAPTLCHQPEVD